MTKRAEWVKHVSEWKASGLSGQAFSEGRDFSTKRLYSWSSKLRRPAKSPVRLARVLAEPSQPSQSERSQRTPERWTIEVTRARVQASNLSEVRTILETALGPSR